MLRASRLLPGGLAALVTALVPVPGMAHDMWLRPSAFGPFAGPVSVALWVGHGDDRGPAPRDDSRIERFAVLSASGNESAVPGVDGTHPAGILRRLPADAVAVVFVSDEARSVLPAAAFDAYLAEEGLERVIEARRATGATGQEGRESYSRSLKALLTPDGGLPADRETGIPLELRILDLVEQGASEYGLRVRLEFRSQPLEDALVDLEPLDPVPATPPREGRTDARGTVAFTVGPGVWKLAAVHMVPSSQPDADWRSFWATTTFALPSRPAPEAGRP